MRTALIFDSETTGLPVWKSPSEAPEQPHIVQLAAALVDVPKRKIISMMDVIIRPDGWDIPRDMTEIHGIDTAMAMRFGIPEDVAVDTLYEMAAQADYRVAYNDVFDNRIIRIGLKRQGDDEAAEAFKAQKSYCAMRASRTVMGGTNPKLAEAHLYFTGEELTGAHSAGNDMLGTFRIYMRLVEMGLGISSGHQEEEAPAPATKIVPATEVTRPTIVHELDNDDDAIGTG